MDVYWNDFTTYIGGRIPWHWHKEMEFVVVVQGKVEISTGDKTIQFQKGEGIFINSNVLHQMIPMAKEESYMFSIVVHPGILGIENGFLLSTKYVVPFIKNDQTKSQTLSPRIEWQNEILLNLHGIYEIHKNKEYAYEYILHNKICYIWTILLQNLWRFQAEKVKVPELDENRIYLAMEYIHEHYAQNMTLKDICTSINVSKSECCRCFQRKLKMTPFEYLMMHRIRVAAENLKNSNQSVTSIALSAGFNSNSYFCKQFRKYMNTSPNEYRKT